MKILDVEKFVIKQYIEIDNDLVYHDINHSRIVTENVIKACEELQLTLEERQILVTASWFHDTGYLIDYSNHEKESIVIATRYLNNRNIDKKIIAQINNCILATKLSVKPKNDTEALLKDVDIAYSLYTDFQIEGQKLKKEREDFTGKKISNEAWKNSQQIFLNKLIFYSEYGKKKYIPILENLKKASY